MSRRQAGRVLAKFLMQCPPYMISFLKKTLHSVTLFQGSSDEAGEATAADVLAVPAMRGLEAGGSRDVDPETTVSSGADAGPPVAEGTEEQEPHEVRFISRRHSCRVSPPWGLDAGSNQS